MASYGLYQGLNEAYDNFRQREREIEAKGDREAAREAEAVRAEREGILFEQGQEEYRYGVDQRPMQERATKTAVESAELDYKTSKQKYDEFMTPEAKAQRVKTAELELNALKNSETIAKLQIDDAQMRKRAAEGAEKYRKWKLKFMGDGDAEALKNAFNSDEDEANDIERIDGSEEEGWTVHFENLGTMKFADRNEVGIHLESMADPVFHQKYLLQNEAEKAALATAIAKHKDKSADTLSAEKKTWETQSQKITDRLYGKVVPEGFIDFGEEGNRKIAVMVGSIIDQVGGASKYNLHAKEVGLRVQTLLEASTDMKEEAVRRRAEEKYDAIPAASFPKGVKPDKGDPGYEDFLKGLMYKDVSSQIAGLERRVMASYFKGDPNNPDGFSVRENPPAITESAEGASTSAGDVLPKPDLPAVDATQKTRDYASEWKPTEKEQRDMDAMLKNRQQRYGIKTRKGTEKPKDVTAKQKKAITKDYQVSFYKMSPAMQKAWFDQFGPYLRPADRKRARQEIEQNLGQIVFDKEFDAKDRAADKSAQTYGVTGTTAS